MNPAAKPPVHFSMLRSYRAADIITLCNAAAGTTAIFAIMSYLIAGGTARVYTAAALIGAAFIFDIADGKFARGGGNASVFGRELDSLADIVSFGVAPAVLAYALGMRGELDVVLLVYFVVCGISRLARYNITAAALSNEAGKVRYFEGMPIPSSLILVAIVMACFQTGKIGEELPLGRVELAGLRWHPLSALFFISGSLMISRSLRIPKL